jgi:hypothetical protein
LRIGKGRPTRGRFAAPPIVLLANVVAIVAIHVSMDV